MNPLLTAINTDLAIGAVIGLIILLAVCLVVFIIAISIPVQILAAFGLGIAIGLLATLLVSLSMSVLIGGLSIYVPITMAIAFCTVASAILTIRRKELLPHLNTEEEKLEDEKKQHKGNFLLDASILIDGRIVSLIRAGFFSNQVELLSAVVRDIYNLTNSTDRLTQERAKQGLRSIDTLKSTLADHLVFIDREVPEGSSLTPLLIEYAAVFHLTIITADNVFASMVRDKNLTAININDLSRILQATSLEGQRIMVTVREMGTVQGEGIGFLEDGTKVIIKNGDAYVGRQLEVVIERTLETVGGRIIYTVPTMTT